MIANLALIIWPVVGIVLFNKLNVPLAACVTIIGGYLLLPESVGMDLPVLPALDKESIPSLTALIMTIIKLRQPGHNLQMPTGWIPRDKVTLTLLAVLVLGNFGTVITNQDPLFYGSRMLSGTRIYDGFAFNLIILMMIIPMLIARKVLATPDTQRTFLIVLAVSALAYSIPVLWEIRMSPQLHRQIYGFFQHGFGQQVRGSGFRSMVFVSHGLTLSIFLAVCILATGALIRVTEATKRTKYWMLLLWLIGVLILNKSLGALMILIIVLPLILFLRPRTQLLAAACLAGSVMIYPLLRAADVVPTAPIISIAESISVDRAKSLQFRLNNEDVLLEKARQRPVFGWGGWNRNRVFADNGRDISVTDGEWVIVFGIGGWLRYIGFFGLLCWPIIALFLAKRDRIDPICAALALVLCARLLDLIPNSGVFPYVWLIAGALLGRLELQLNPAPDPVAPTPDDAPSGSPYRRALSPRGAPKSNGPPARPKGPAYTRIETIKQRRTP